MDSLFKRPDRLIIAGICLVFIIWAIAKCSKRGGKPAAEDQQVVAGKSVIFVSTDSMYVRTKPSRNDSVVTTVYRGEPIFYLGERTGAKAKIKLDGVEHNEPWLKVETKNKKVGWVYGGGVKIYK